MDLKLPPPDLDSMLCRMSMNSTQINLDLQQNIQQLQKINCQTRFIEMSLESFRIISPINRIHNTTHVPTVRSKCHWLLLLFSPIGKLHAI